MTTQEFEHAAINEHDMQIYSGKAIATGVAYEDFLSGEFGTHTEWIHGVVIDMSPVSSTHDALSRFIETLLDTYLALTDGGRVLQDPMVMRPGEDFPARQPDVQVLLPDRMGYLQENQVAGPASLVVEIVSPESVKRDRGEKFSEYERAGVGEYWVIDPIRHEALFYVLGEDALFRSHLPVDGVYTSHVLDRLRLEVAILWRESLPNTPEIVRMVEVQLAGE